MRCKRWQWRRNPFDSCLRDATSVSSRSWLWSHVMSWHWFVHWLGPFLRVTTGSPPLCDICVCSVSGNNFVLVSGGKVSPQLCYFTYCVNSIIGLEDVCCLRPIDFFISVYYDIIRKTFHGVPWPQLAYFLYTYPWYKPAIHAECYCHCRLHKEIRQEGAGSTGERPMNCTKEGDKPRLGESPRDWQNRNTSVRWDTPLISYGRRSTRLWHLTPPPPPTWRIRRSPFPVPRFPSHLLSI